MSAAERPLEGQVAVVTGGGKGLGRAFARHLADLGAAVVVNNRNRQVDAQGRGPADHVTSEILAAGGRAVAHHGDVADPETGTSLVQLALEHFGRLDICVTSAAVSMPQMLHKTSAEHFRTVMEVNVTGTALVIAPALAHMRAAGHGRLVLVASTAGLHGEPTVSAYAASKGAVIALGRTAAAEGAPKGVLTNVLLPYATTQMTEQGMDPRHADRMRSELVAPVVGALADPRCTLNGQVVVAAGSGIRLAESVEGGTVRLQDAARLDPFVLSDLLDRSRAGERHTYSDAQAAFQSLAADLA
ncbi:SDR family NAD(P)-dependent oxidoreductase [Janibacter melonis]|uniref:SDR family NAD(P)-dependent oxidoreductase n=1 Tax=Janibacter melonis TaxID=262209 RepID=UPI001E4BE0D0|nr:SDR family NAD(P)-dependent oxidoreductase [Janibacter melonis]MCB5991916.1 SDR family NAD(P)-dependent oxidoreductase [Janibacter melonis]